MKRYAAWNPTHYDTRGLNHDEQQDWFVFGVGRNRDSDTLAESNFDAALALLGGESDTCNVCRFGHWACGWFEIILLHPTRLADGEAIEARLDDYPVLDEDDWSQRESDEADESWTSWACRDFRDAVTSLLELEDCDDADENSLAAKFAALSDADCHAWHCNYAPDPNEFTFDYLACYIDELRTLINPPYVDPNQLTLPFDAVGAP